MQHFQGTFLADDTLPRDEIDDLFEKLQPIEPPPSLIQRILNSVSHLPPPDQVSKLQDGTDPPERLIIRNDQRPAS